MTTAWTHLHVEGIRVPDVARLSCYPPELVARPRPELHYWDMWPVQDRDGNVANVRAREFWMVLAAPDEDDPSARHFASKIHLLERLGGDWKDLGPVLPDREVPYEREWSGSAIWSEGRFTLWFTGAGLAEAPGGYQQALFETVASSDGDGCPRDWTVPRPILTDLTSDYIAANEHEGEAGRIKAFRDPAYFRDPVDGQEYLVWTASSPAGGSEYTGAIGLARRVAGEWKLLPPLIHSGGVNNELERAHVVYAQGRYLVFWATQASTFAPDLPGAPTGLYGMIADTLFGPYRPLNGTGLVLANPASRPSQGYSWSVTRELLVSSFVDRLDEDGAFAGAPAPLEELALDVENARAWPIARERTK